MTESVLLPRERGSAVFSPSPERRLPGSSQHRMVHWGGKRRIRKEGFMESRTTAGISVVAMVLVALAPCAYAKTIFVANNGADSSTCGPTGHAPCRSITQGIHNAANGDLIIVGPGKYGDLNGNGVLGEPGEETPAANCFCMLAVNKSVTIVSSDGAAATVIDAHTVDVFNNVVFTANGA